MQNESSRAAVAAAMQRINQAWLAGRPGELVSLFDPDVVMVRPGFSGRVTGRDAMIAGFVDFCGHARVHEYLEKDRQVDVTADTGVVSFAWEMVYERSSQRYRATGRDLWVFARQGGEWLAVWRTMLDLAEQPA